MVKKKCLLKIATKEKIHLKKCTVEQTTKKRIRNVPWKKLHKKISKSHSKKFRRKIFPQTPAFFKTLFQISKTKRKTFKSNQKRTKMAPSFFDGDHQKEIQLKNGRASTPL
jgi:hypothetical protein